MAMFASNTKLPSAGISGDWNTIVKHYKKIAVLAGMKDAEFWKEFNELAGYITPVTSILLTPVGTPITNTEQLIVELFQRYNLL